MTPLSLTNHWPKSTFRFLGGGGLLPAAPISNPPVQANNAASLSVQQSEYRQQLRRKSLNQTIYAGATGGMGGGGSNVPGQNAVQSGSGPSVASGGATKTG
jgi:hypothetical protein